MKPRPSVDSHDSPSTIAAASGAHTLNRYFDEETVAPRMAGASAEGAPSPYELVLTKNWLPVERTLRRLTPALEPWQTATAILWFSKEQSLITTPSLRRADPEGETSTPTTKRWKLHCSSV